MQDRIFNLDEFLARGNRPSLQWQGREYLLKEPTDFSPTDIGRYRGIGELLANIPDDDNAENMAAWRANMADFMQGMFYAECPPIDWANIPVRGIVGFCDFLADKLAQSMATATTATTAAVTEC